MKSSSINRLIIKNTTLPFISSIDNHHLNKKKHKNTKIHTSSKLHSTSKQHTNNLVIASHHTNNDSTTNATITDQKQNEYYKNDLRYNSTVILQN